MAGEAGPTAADRRWGMLGVGCLGIFAGFFGGGMIAVLIAKIVGSVRHCEPASGLPACDHVTYLAAGSVMGAIVLPTVSIVLMRRNTRRN